MITADDSQVFRRTIHPAALAALGRDGRLRDLARSVLTPARPGLADARRAVADVLFALPSTRAKRFEARGVMYFDFVSAAAQAEATREVWEAACDRLDLAWTDHGTRRFFDRAVRSWQSRDGDRVRVHVQGAGGTEESSTLGEDELLDADDPSAVLRGLGARPMVLEHPPTLAAVVALTSAHDAVAAAESLAWEAVHGATRGMRAPPVVVWRVEDRARLLATRADEIAVLGRGVRAMELWAERTGAWRRFHPSVPDPFEAVLAICETGMLLDAITPEWISLVCPSVS